MKILLTGALGFIGSNFVKKLLDGSVFIGNFSKITIIDAKTYAANLENLRTVLNDPRLEIIIGDISNLDIVNSVTFGKNLVINFAAESHVDKSILGPKKFIDSNLIGVYNLLEALKKNSYEKLIHISTDEVYGSIETGYANEKSPLSPNSPYSASKASADLLINSYFKTFGTPVIITRCSNNYGPYQNIEKFLPRMITNLIDKKTIPIYGSGLNIRDWIHVDDHCKGIAYAVNSGEIGEIYNIAGNYSLTNLELANIVLSKMKLDHRFIEFVPDRLGHDFRYSISGEKILTLGFKPDVDFDTGISRTIEWYLRNQTWWRTTSI